MEILLLLDLVFDTICIIQFLFFFCLPNKYSKQIHIGGEGTRILYEEAPEEERQGCRCCCLDLLRYKFRSYIFCDTLANKFSSLLVQNL